MDKGMRKDLSEVDLSTETANDRACQHACQQKIIIDEKRQKLTQKVKKKLSIFNTCPDDNKEIER